MRNFPICQLYQNVNLLLVFHNYKCKNCGKILFILDIAHFFLLGLSFNVINFQSIQFKSESGNVVVIDYRKLNKIIHIRLSGLENRKNAVDCKKKIVIH